MGTSERRERERNDLREKIMDAARELFATQGFEAVSMRKIAEKIEYSPTAIYMHFADKQTLVRELMRADFAKFDKAFHEAAGEVDPVERIRAVGRQYIRFAVAHPKHFQLMFMTPGFHGEPDAECLSGRGNPDEDGYAFLALAVQQAIDQGRVKQPEHGVHLITQTLWAAVHGVAALQVAKHDDPWIEFQPLEQRIEAMIDLSTEGLFKPVKVRTTSKVQRVRHR